MSIIYFMLSRVEYKKRFITSGYMCPEMTWNILCFNIMFVFLLLLLLLFFFLFFFFFFFFFLGGGGGVNSMHAHMSYYDVCLRWKEKGRGHTWW